MKLDGPTPLTLAPPLRFMGIDEFVSFVPEPQHWYIDGLIPAGSATLFAGREKSGKTSILIDLVCGVATGEPFLGRETRTGNVLLIAMEDHIREIQSRVLTRLGDERPRGFFYLPPRYIGFNDSDLRLEDNYLMQRLKAGIVQHNISVIAFDPLRELHDMAENDADEMAPTVRVLRELAHELNVAIIVSHHASRGGGYRGSTAIGGAVDQIISFKRKDQEGDDAWIEGVPEGVMRVEGRYGPRQVMQIAMGEDFRWEVGGRVPQGKSGNLRSRALDTLRQHVDGLTNAELAERCATTLPTMRNLMSQMLSENDPNIVKDAPPNPNQPARYRALDPFGLYFGEGDRYA